MAEENRIMEEIEGVLTGVPDREEAEKIVLKQYAPLMEEAMKKSTEAFREWRESARKIGGSA